jgi:hypothetical protein
LKGLSQAFPDRLNLGLLDKGRFHKGKGLVIPHLVIPHLVIPHLVIPHLVIPHLVIPHLVIPHHVRLVFLPPYSPELNPIERVWQALSGKPSVASPQWQALSGKPSVASPQWQALKGPLSWANFDAVGPLKERVRELLTEQTPAQLQSLTPYDYILQALIGSFLS